MIFQKLPNQCENVQMNKSKLKTMDWKCSMPEILFFTRFGLLSEIIRFISPPFESVDQSINSSLKWWLIPHWCFTKAPIHILSLAFFSSNLHKTETILLLKFAVCPLPQNQFNSVPSLRSCLQHKFVYEYENRDYTVKSDLGNFEIYYII